MFHIPFRNTQSWYLLPFTIELLISIVYSYYDTGVHDSFIDSDSSSLEIGSGLFESNLWSGHTHSKFSLMKYLSVFTTLSGYFI